MIRPTPGGTLALSVCYISFQLSSVWMQVAPMGMLKLILIFAAALLQASRFGDAFQIRAAKHHKDDNAYLAVRDEHKGKEQAFLVAIVTSPASWRERRGWLREQWDKNIRYLQEYVVEKDKDMPRIVFKFAIGVPYEESEDIQGVMKEEKEFGDILLLHGIDDLEVDYMHLHPHWPWYNTSATTEKVLYSIEWAVKHYDFQYFARIGDDAYFRPDEFYRQVSAGEISSERAVMGLMTGPLPYNVAGREALVVYPMGGGYVMTHDVAAFVSRSAYFLNVGFPEDANFGAWLAGTKTRFIDFGDRMHDWDTGSPHYRPCSPRDLLIHHMRKEANWQRIDSSGEMSC